MTGPALTYNTGTTGTDFNISSTGNIDSWNLPSASTTARGVVTTTAQTFSGLKTLANGVIVNNGSTLNNGTTANNGLTVTGATTNTSNLTLGVTSATVPTAQTDRYLSVNAAGNVTLNTLNTLTSVTAGGTPMTGPALIYNTGTAGTDFNISSTGNTATWNLPSASTTARGAVTTTAQTFSGLKTLQNGVIVNNGSTLNNGTTANGGLTVTGATTNTSNLTLGVTSATVPAAQTDRYLSVDAAGNVTLNTLNTLTTVTAGGTPMTGPALTYNTGTAGTDFNISSTGNTATWNLPSASTTARGAVTTTTQTFSGLKTLANGVIVNNGSTLNNGTTANNGLTVTGATTNTSNLTLGVTSATAPAAQTDRYLSVNAAGNVTLNTLNTLTSVTAGGTPMTGPALTYNTGTAGTDFNISSTGNTATWNLPSASTTARGAVTTAAQTFGGLKTLANGVIVNNGSTLNNGTTANNGLTVTGATTNTSNLTLGVTSATVPAAQTDRYLSVNAAGNVTLNTLNTLTSVTAGGAPMTGPALTYNTGTAGTDFNISSTGNTATWNLPSASTTARGAVTTAAQTFGGLKTLANGVIVNNGSTLNNGTTANDGLTVTGAVTNTSNLTLGITSATLPGVNTDKYLSVNASGNVTLNSVNVTSGAPIKIKSFHVEINEAPLWLYVGTPQIFTFTLPGAALSLTSTVTVSPVSPLREGTRINWARVSNATTIQIALSAENANQKLNPGIGNEADFYVTVFEF